MHIVCTYFNISQQEIILSASRWYLEYGQFMMHGQRNIKFYPIPYDLRIPRIKLTVGLWRLKGHAFSQSS